MRLIGIENMTRTYTVYLKDKQVKVTSEQMSEFADYCGFKDDLRLRISELILLDSFVYVTEFGVDPSNIIEEIKNLENVDGNAETKPATAFNRPPLRGLWHKHFFCHHFLMHNITNALKGGKLKALINDVMESSKSSLVTPEMISELAHRVTHEPVEDRAKNKKLTGEWIVFAKHNGKNYYLCLSTHDAGDQQIADRIRENCVREFSFLSSIVGSPSV